MADQEKFPKQQLDQLFTPKELTDFGAPTEIRDTSAVSAALGGIGLGDVETKGLPGNIRDKQTPHEEYEITLSKIKTLWDEPGALLSKALIAQVLDLDEQQVAMSLGEWRERPDVIEYLDDDLLLTDETNGRAFKMPKIVGGDLDLQSLPSAAADTIFPEFVSGDLSLTSLRSDNDIVLPRFIGRHVNLATLKTARNIVFPRQIDGGLGLIGIESAEGIVLPEKIGRALLLGIKSAKGLILPEHIGGPLQLPLLESTENLVEALQSFEGLVTLPRSMELNHVRLQNALPQKCKIRFSG